MSVASLLPVSHGGLRAGLGGRQTRWATRGATDSLIITLRDCGASGAAYRAWTQVAEDKALTSVRLTDEQRATLRRYRAAETALVDGSDHADPSFGKTPSHEGSSPLDLGPLPKGEAQTVLERCARGYGGAGRFTVVTARRVDGLWRPKGALVAKDFDTGTYSDAPTTVAGVAILRTGRRPIRSSRTGSPRAVATSSVTHMPPGARSRLTSMHGFGSPTRSCAWRPGLGPTTVRGDGGCHGRTTDSPMRRPGSKISLSRTAPLSR